MDKLAYVSRAIWLGIAAFSVLDIILPVAIVYLPSGSFEYAFSVSEALSEHTFVAGAV